MNNAVRWIGIAFVLGLCAAYALWAPRAEPKPPVAANPPATPELPSTPLQPNPGPKTQQIDPAHFPVNTALKVEPKEVDFGDVSVNDTRKASVQVHNTGDKPITITRMQQSCGCLRVDMPVKTIQPGKSETVVLTFHALAGKRAGDMTAALLSDEVGGPSVYILAKGHVKEYFEVKPANVAFEDLRKGEKRELSATVTSRDDAPFTIRTIKSNKDTFTYRWEPVPASQNRAYTVRINATAKSAGSLIDQVTVVTDHGLAPSVTFTVTLNVLNDVEIVPPRLSAEQSFNNEIGPFEATLKRRTPGTLKVESVTENEKMPLKFETTDLPDGSVKLKIEFTKVFAKAVPFGEFQIRTNAEEELLRVPYRLRPKSRNFTDQVERRTKPAPTPPVPPEAPQPPVPPQAPPPPAKP